MQNSKDRETYSFSISNNNANDKIMNQYLNSKLKQGIKISSYIRSLIEKDMIKDGVLLGVNVDDNTKKKESIEKIEEKIEEMHSMFLKFDNSSKAQYEKMVHLEFLLKNNSNPYATNVAYGGNSDNNLDSDSVDKILEAINGLYGYNNDRFDTTKSLLDVINTQNNMIEQLLKK